jgi:hypothetical protein
MHATFRTFYSRNAERGSFIGSISRQTGDNDSERLRLR